MSLSLFGCMQASAAANFFTNPGPAVLQSQKAESSNPRSPNKKISDYILKTPLKKTVNKKFVSTFVAASTALLCTGAQADIGKLLLTGGVSSIEGAAGGGLTPWAVIGSNATDEESGGSAFFTRVGSRDYGLNIAGATIGIHDRYE